MDADPYQLVRRIGDGVWLADHPVYGRVVLKRATAHEVRVAVLASSTPGVVRVVDAGGHYLAMDLAGEPLDLRVRRRRRLAVKDALRIAGELARTLCKLHARGIVHRDVKPENVVIGDRATLIDFGSALAPGSAGPPFSGTPEYMAPEQARAGARIDARTDVYAVGGVLFAMLAGRPPFEGERAELIARHAAEPAPRLSTLLAGIAPALDDAVARCLAKDPADRFASGAELAAALDAIDDHEITPRPSASRAPGLPAAATTLSASALALDSVHEPRGASLALAGLAVLAASLLAIVTGVRIAARTGEPPVAAARQPLAPVGACHR